MQKRILGNVNTWQWTIQTKKRRREMQGDNKEVYFHKFCPGCKHEETPESDPNGPCYDCLDCPVNQDTHKPINWEPKDGTELPAKDR